MAIREGAFVWFELLTSDTAAAAEFYAAVAGWTIAEAGVPGLAYTLAKVGQHPVAGLMGQPPDRIASPALWFGYVLVADVDATATRVAQAGGAVHRPPTAIPGVGRFAVVADPQGALFMLFRGSGDPAPDRPPGTPGTIAWCELHATDWPAAFAFYRRLFGWEQAAAHHRESQEAYQIVSIGSVPFGAMTNRAEGGPPAWRYHIAVEDIDAAARRVTDAGGQILEGPSLGFGGTWLLAGRDPQGVAFALAGPRRA